LLYVCEKGRSVRSEVKLRFFGILALPKSEQRPLFACLEFEGTTKAFLNSPRNPEL
jgi:hypothetical protein